jgi:hypothetical protein
MGKKYKQLDISVMENKWGDFIVLPYWHDQIGDPDAGKGNKIVLIIKLFSIFLLFSFFFFFFFFFFLSFSSKGKELW